MRLSAGLSGAAAMGLALSLLLASCGNDGDTADTADPSTKVLVALALETDDKVFGKAAGDAVPGSGATEFLTLSEIASSDGAQQSVVDTAIKELGDQGLDVRADPTNSVLWGEVEVSTAEKLFDVTFETQKTENGGQSIRTTGSPKVPDGVKGVTAVSGLSGTTQSGEVETGSSSTTGESTTTSSALPACPGGEVTKTSLAGKYGFEGLIDLGVTGDDVTVATLEVESFDTRVFDSYDQCPNGQLDTSRVAETGVELSPEPTPGSEVALDTVTIGLLAPGADQQITRFDPESSIVFPLLSILDSVGNGATPEVLLSTVAFCEDSLSDADVEIGERLLATFALTGTTTVASSGDIGSSSCHPGTTDPAVQYPASSAWVTAVGGASFDGSATAPTDLAVWNGDPDNKNAGGGGTSTKVDRPAWQEGIGDDGDKRAVPDVSAFAAPGGVGLYPTCTDESCEWQELGGTSLSGAAVAGGLALMLQPEPGSDTARRVGHLAPTVHASASTAATDVTDGNNHVFTKQCCSAGVGYDRASGWGLLDLSSLVGVSSANG